MHRALVLFVTFLLPLQIAWGAVTAYCQHEDGAGSQHFGHHEHVHKAQHSASADAGAWDQDNDCGTCHAAGLAALTASFGHQPRLAAGAAPLQVLPPPPTSPPREQPERPRWGRLA